MKSNLLTVEDILACKGHLVAIDCETNGLHWWENDVIGFGIHCPAAGVSGYVHTCWFEDQPYGNPKSRKRWQGKMDYSKSTRGRRVLETVVEQPVVKTAMPAETRIRHFTAAVREVASDPNTTLLGHNLKFDAHFLRLNLWELGCRILDTSVMVHLYDSRMLKSLAAAENEFLGSASKRHHVTLADKRFRKQVWRWDAQVIADYCINDCVVTYQLAEVLVPKLREKGLLRLLSSQMRYLRLLQKMEWRGIQVATVFCHEAITEFDHNLKSMEHDLFDTVGYEFNWRSNSQLSKAIYDDLGIPKPVNPFPEDRFDIQNFRAAKLYTESATSTPLLIREKHPLVSTLMDLRETAKLREYAQKYIDLRDSKGILHASFNQNKTLTGRLSSGSPNLQQLPSTKRKVDVASAYTGGADRLGGYNLRQAIVPRSGYTLVSIDHKQQEVRLLAILANEEVLLEAMRNREDIHLRGALEIWGDCGEEANKLHREWNKAITFGLIYGLSEDSLQEYFTKVGIEANAAEVKEQYFETFPGLRPWFQEVIAEVKATGGVTYWSGRRWWADDPSEGYKGVNALIQGGCADFMSVVVMRCNQVLEKQEWGYIISIIHDEVLFEVENQYLETALPVLARAMEGEDIFGIPFATDIEVGDSYGTLGGYALSVDLAGVEWRDYV